MKKLCFFACSLALASGVVSCGNDNDDPTPAASKVALLTAKSWRVSAEQTVSVSGGTTDTSDDYADYQACEKDDFIKFNADKTVTEDQGATKRSNTSSNPQSVTTDKWDLNSDGTKLTFSSGSFAIVSDVVELSATTLKLKLTLSSANDSYTQTTTYTAF